MFLEAWGRIGSCLCTMGTEELLNDESSTLIFFNLTSDKRSEVFHVHQCIYIYISLSTMAVPAPCSNSAKLSITHVYQSRSKRKLSTSHVNYERTILIVVATQLCIWADELLFEHSSAQPPACR
jgi:hypothetical protein